MNSLMKVWLLYIFSAGPSSSSDKAKEKGSPAKVLDKSGQVGSSPKVSKRKKGKGKDSGTSSEEERWLDAIESGKLEEVRSFSMQVIT
jgi:INO80 complex subunit B